MESSQLDILYHHYFTENLTCVPYIDRCSYRLQVLVGKNENPTNPTKDALAARRINIVEDTSSDDKNLH